MNAVILAGGRGTRLRPLTDSIPKPMVEFHGKPFLEFLIEMVRDQGIDRFMLLLGYLPEVVQDYFGDGRKWGVSIEYSVTAEEDETGRRLKLAQPRIDPTFLLMYCDNYWPLQLDSMSRQFVGGDAKAMVTVYRNADGYTRDNLRVDGDGYVIEYDKTRASPGLSGVDIGFILMNRSVVDMLPNENVSFEEVIYPQLVAQRQLRAYVTDHRYYSVGSLERLPATEEFLARRPAVLLDRDGVLNERPPQAEYVRTWSEWEWIPGARDALRLLKEAGYSVIIVSNQSGIARGKMTEAAVDEIHKRVTADVLDAGGQIDRIYYCPHGWDEGCECRKPKPGMLFKAQRDFSLDLSRTYFVGDDDRDHQAADAAGCRWAMVSDQTSLLDVTKGLLNGSLPNRSRS